jgi:CheY-like chemotaxis protein
MHVLIADDEAPNRLFLSRVLHRHLQHARIDCVADGAAAVRMVAADAGGFHVVCLDHEMPGLGGRATAAQLRALGFRGLIVGVTGNASATDAAEFVRAGANTVLLKPVNVPQLVALVDAHMQHGSGAP